MYYKIIVEMTYDIPEEENCGPLSNKEESAFINLDIRQELNCCSYTYDIKSITITREDNQNGSTNDV